MRRTRRFRRSIWLLSTLMGTLLIAACGQQPAPAKPAGQGTAAAPATPAAAPQSTQTAPPAPKREVLQLTVGTSGSTSSFYAYWAATANAVNEKLKGDIQLNIVESGSTVDNLKRMKKGEFHFGNSAIGTVYQAYKGEGGWEAMPELRWFWSFVKMPYLIITRADANIKNPTDLHGKAFSGGDIGSGSFKGLQNVLGAIGVDPDWLKGSFQDGATAMKNRQIVGMSKLAAGVKAREAMYMDIMTTAKVHFPSFTPEQAEKIQQKYPFYSWITIPKGVYEGQDYEIFTPGDMAGGVVNSKLPQDVGYRIVKAVMETKDKQVQAFPGAEPTDYIADSVLTNPKLPLHAGLVQYLKEKGVNVPADLIPPEYKAP